MTRIDIKKENFTAVHTEANYEEGGPLKLLKLTSSSLMKTHI